jgi:hypothetical protein
MAQLLFSGSGTNGILAINSNSMQKLSTVILFLFLSLASVAQFTVTGKIIDSATREPMAGASVFCQNTTVGSATNREGEFALQLRSGGYDLIISYTGYVTKQLRINQNDGRIPDIEMVKEDKSLGEVIVKTSNEVKDGWEKYGAFFMDHFIGTTPNATKFKLLNPEALHFYLLKKSNKLRVLATEPLQMQNNALGYNLRYLLDTFIYNYNNDINSYRGFSLYTAMEGDDSLKRVWAANRKAVYYGSKLQFMRSYYDSTLTEDGFVVDLLDENNATKFNRVTDVYDTLYYGGLDSTGQVEIWYPRKFSVTYVKRKPEPEYLKQFKLPKNVSTQISYIELTNGIAINENGYYYDQRDWVSQGYWSWKNLADQLPYDYTP